MALWVCQACGCRYSVGAPCCPQCRGTDHEEEDGMPHITVHGGPNNPDDTEGGDQLSAGSSSSTSASRPAESSRPTASGPRSPAPATVSPSATPRPPTPAPASSSTASSADGSTPATGSAPSSSEDPPPLRAPKADWAEHAVAAGVAAPEDVEGMTKAQIVETVTEAGDG